MAIPEDPPPGIPDWVLTFGDMMSLLLTFFILLVSMSEIKQDDKFQGIADSIQEHFGYETAPADVPGESQPRNSSLAALAMTGRSRRKNTEDAGIKAKSVAGEEPRVRIIRPGNRTAVGSVIFFAEGQVDLDDLQRDELRKLALSLVGKPQKIEVRGHTTRKPIEPQGEISDQLDLAYRRARQVSQFLEEDLRIEPLRIRISVAGPNEPLNDSSQPEKIAENDRVEVFLLEELAEGA